MVIGVTHQVVNIGVNSRFVWDSRKGSNLKKSNFFPREIWKTLFSTFPCSNRRPCRRRQRHLCSNCQRICVQTFHCFRWNPCLRNQLQNFLVPHGFRRRRQQCRHRFQWVLDERYRRCRRNRRALFVSCPLATLLRQRLEMTCLLTGPSCGPSHSVMTDSCKTIGISTLNRSQLIQV